MDDDTRLIDRLYQCFNARDTAGVLSAVADDVAWANGMSGGHLHGHQALRDYWTHQWSVVNPHVEPVAYRRDPDGAVVAEVRQSVHDLQGRPIADATHGLRSRTLLHVFHLRDGKVTRFDIRDAP